MNFFIREPLDTRQDLQNRINMIRIRPKDKIKKKFLARLGKFRIRKQLPPDTDLNPWFEYVIISAGGRNSIQYTSCTPGSARIMNESLYRGYHKMHNSSTSVADLEDPYIFEHPGSGSISTRYGFGSGSFYHQAKLVRKALMLTVF
jgi:hypothetical protein